MAAKNQGFSSHRHTYLSPPELHEIEKQLQSPEQAPTGSLSQTIDFSGFAVAQLLSKKILEKLEKNPLWLRAHPILLGSWGRGEIAAKSDLDVLFLGDEQIVREVVSEIEAQGLRIRYRVPKNFEDWSEGVLVPDCLALWGAQALTTEGQQALQAQQQKIFSSMKHKKRILKVILEERKERARRFDSISNFLDPNLKYGGGGLRDIFQGLVVADIFAELFANASYEKKILRYYLGFFLTLRQKLHFSGFSDTLVSSEQADLARWFGYQDSHQFMRQIQRGISRVAFYSEWILELAKKPRASSPRKLHSAKALFFALKKDPSVLGQHRVRRDMDRLFKPPMKSKGIFLDQVLSVQAEDSWIQAVFRSRLIDKLCPRIVHLVGYVQHDQYHRFTADAHILQACREVKRIYKKPASLGPLKKIHGELGPVDWKIIAWSCLYHDMAKGISGHDHSELGEKWVREDLKKYGFSRVLVREVEWLVRHHLELSTAAFRKNPKAPSTWQELQELELTEKRLLRLALFTAIDIRATNPEAWNEWKAKLLADLVDTLRSGKTKSFLSVQKQVSPQILSQMDSQVFEIIPASKLAEDLQSCLSANLGWQIFKDSKKRTWLRYHQRSDQAGLLAELLDVLYASGCSIQQALIHTLPELGVYDWFQVQSSKDSLKLKTLLRQMKPSKQIPDVSFLQIRLVSQTPAEWVISFKGIDQKGLLLRAADRLHRLGSHIQSARVHTWGRQVEDLFHIKPMSLGPSELIEKLTRDLV